jgi:hypothetical protein
MKNFTRALPLVAVLALSACSSVKTQVDTGPIAAKSFSFVNPGPKPFPAYADKRAEIHTIIQDAITKGLAAKGITHVQNGGDVTVAYLVIVGNNVSTTSLDDYFGYDSDASALVDKVHNEQAIKGDNRGYFEAGTLVIDLINPQTSKLLKRASVRSSVLRDLPPEVRQARLQSLVDKALSDLRITS